MQGSDFAQLGQERAMSFDLTVPSYGLWSAKVVLAEATVIPQNPILQIGNLSLQGSVYRMASFGGSRSALLVGGYGGWRREIPEKFYQQNNLKLSTVMKDAARESGEKINIAVDAAIGNFYTRERAPAERLLRILCGPSWFVDPGGVTQVSPRPSKKVLSPFIVNSWSGASGLFEISSEDYASWLPGNTFIGPTISNLQTISTAFFHQNNAGILRIKVLTATPNPLA